MSKSRINKKAYIVPCSSRFRQEIESLIRSRNVANDNIGIGDLARAVMLLIPQDVIESQPDPGDPDKNDRDIVTVSTGHSAGRTMPRKPRIQVRLPQQSDISSIRKALGLALSLEKGWVNIALDNKRAEGAIRKLESAEAEIKRLQGLLQILSFKPLVQGVRTRRDALYVLGFTPDANPSQAEIKTAYRTRAMIFHPDSNRDAHYGVFNDHQRMSQLSEAAKLLTKKL